MGVSQLPAVLSNEASPDAGCLEGILFLLHYSILPQCSACVIPVIPVTLLPVTNHDHSPTYLNLLWCTWIFSAYMFQGVAPLHQYQEEILL